MFLPGNPGLELRIPNHPGLELRINSPKCLENLEDPFSHHRKNSRYDMNDLSMSESSITVGKHMVKYWFLGNWTLLVGVKLMKIDCKMHSKIRMVDTIWSPRISGTYNGGTEPYKAILGVGFPLQKPYIQLIKVSTSILGT